MEIGVAKNKAKTQQKLSNTIPKILSLTSVSHSLQYHSIHHSD